MAKTATKEQVKEPEKRSGALAIIPPPPSICAMIASGGRTGNVLAKEFDEGLEETGQETTREAEYTKIRIDHNAEQFVVSKTLIGNKVKGYLLHYVQQRSFWEKPYKPGSSTPPDCHSLDMIQPGERVDRPQAEFCEKCPQAKFGSARDEKSQACAVSTFLFLVDPQSQVFAKGFAVLVIPPSSMKNIIGTQREGGGYVGSAKAFDPNDGLGAAGKYQLVYGEFEVMPKKEGAANCMVEAHPVGRVPNSEEVQALVKIRKALMDGIVEKLKGQRVDPHEDDKKADDKAIDVDEVKKS